MEKKIDAKRKDKARISILGEIMQFPSINKWVSCYFEFTPQVGDLVAMNCVSNTKFYMSWLREIDPNDGWPKYLLESIEDGELCWWSNVGISYYDREIVKNRPQWKWTNEQFDFSSRWNRVCRKNDAYIVLPLQAVFTDNGGVTLDVRIRFGLDEYHNPATFENWKKVTMKMMDEYYKKSSDEYNRKSAERREAAKKAAEKQEAML